MTQTKIILEYSKINILCTYRRLGMTFSNKFSISRYRHYRWDPDSDIKPNQYAFMPFVMGPRNCVGMRFAMEEMKIALCTIVKNFRFFPVPETPVS